MFVPPFCPYAACAAHIRPPRSAWWAHAGHHSTKAFGRVNRFRCAVCGRTFSTQTFSVDYYCKRVIAYIRLERLSASAMSIRALGREYKASCATITNRIDRLSRQGVALHTSLRKEAGQGEALCFDGLVSFERSQDFPADIGISITAHSRFVLGLSHATTRRSGRMRPGQKKRQERRYSSATFEKRAIQRSFSDHLDMLHRDWATSTTRPLVLITDEKPDYARALRRHPLYLSQSAERRCAHVQIPSTAPRVFANPLFASNYYEREVRKDQAQHHRETCCFARNAANDMNRLYAYLVWHNYSKRYSIKGPVHKTATHAEVAGMAASAIRAARVTMFGERAFLSRLKLLPIDECIWKKTVHQAWSGGRGSVKLPNYAVA